MYSNDDIEISDAGEDMVLIRSKTTGIRAIISGGDLTMIALSLISIHQQGERDGVRSCHEQLDRVQLHSA